VLFSFFNTYKALPVQAYVAGKKLKIMLTACLGQDVRYFCLSPAPGVARGAEVAEKRNHFFHFCEAQ